MTQVDNLQLSPSSCSSATASPALDGARDAPTFTLSTAPSALISTLSALLQAAVHHNDAFPAPPLHSMTVFHALEPPSISVPDYVARVAKYVFCSEACLVLAYDYMLRAVRRHSSLALSSLSVHRLFITSVVLACKFLDDVSYNLAYYAKVGGLPTAELANLEIHMLRLLDFRLDVSPEHFVALEGAMVTELHSLCPPGVSPVVAELAGKARNQLADADIMVPLPTSPANSQKSMDVPASPVTPRRRQNFVQPARISDDDEADEERRQDDGPRMQNSCTGKAVPASPVSSECPTDSTMSRNSSMNSVTESDCHKAAAISGFGSDRHGLPHQPRVYSRFA